MAQTKAVDLLLVELAEPGQAQEQIDRSIAFLLLRQSPSFKRRRNAPEAFYRIGKGKINTPHERRAG